MPVVRVKGVQNPMQFPDDMEINDIRSFLQRRFANQAVAGNQPMDLAPLQGQARASEQSLAQKAGQGISDALVDSGIISDRFGAQQIGQNVTSIGEFLPGIGDAASGDEFGRALKQGDNFGMAMGALGAIPLVGDAAKKVFKGANPINMYDTTRNRLLRKESTVNLPQGNVGSDEFDRIKDLDPNAKVLGRNDDGTIKISYLEEYSPNQVNKDNDFLFEFEPDALEITEPDYKNIEIYRGDPNKPISVTKKDGDFFILDGHHRAKLAKDKGNNVKAVVIPFSDVESMKKDNIHPAEMFSEWVATGRNKQPSTDKAMSVGESLKLKYPDLSIGVRETDSNIILDKVIVPEKQKGTGTKFMNDLIADADSKGKPIGLTPSSDFGGNKKRLTEFYKRFGFTENKGKNKDFEISESLIRPANKATK